jgi:hypothetical protein
MERNTSSSQFEVLNPWPEVDPVPLRGISPRLGDLKGKTIGLFVSDFKVASRPILDGVEQRLKERFPSLQLTRFFFPYNLCVTDTEYRERFEQWVKGIDAAVAAVGD